LNFYNPKTIPMPSPTNEAALEATIEAALIGRAVGEEDGDAQEPGSVYGGQGFMQGQKEDFNTKYALDERFFWAFLEQTQPAELAKVQKSTDWKLRILERFDRMVKKYGILRLLRKGLEVDDATFTLFYQLPPSGSTELAKQRFEQNLFSVTRQIHYNLDRPAESIDMVIFLNGMAIATLELKNPWTGQSAAVHGVRQYKKDRDIRQPLLQFARCVVHFAVDTDEVYMTTKLNGDATFFLPFNKGHHEGKGNPPNPFGHKTEYLWREVFTRESLSNILQQFVRLDGDAKEPLMKRTLFFPRYHQLDVVRKILQHVSTQGVGHSYLIQHSAGSGKSNSITWAAYQLIEAYPTRPDIQGARSLQQPLFDTVIVVTDRRLLDKQLRENIREFSEVKNIIAPAYSSKELKTSLEQGKKIIITTIQKFPFIIEGIADLSDKRFAVIIDEAHSSQSGTAAAKMNQALGKGEAPEEEEEADAQEFILRAMLARKMKDNASYLAFTATPKNATLEKFGQKDEHGKFRPFHLYSMKQAIEEGFILDVLSNYTTYKSYYEIQKSIADNPLFDSAKAQKKLKAYVERDPRTIATKAEIMLEHFMTSVFNTKKLKGKAKGMVITQNIEAAIRYYKALDKQLKEMGYPFKILIAFSGKKIVDGIEYTEGAINGFGENDTREKFELDDYRLLVVANKYLTGFDQPKLCAMYVDKKLQGVLAVQALSRLNRSASKYNKRTEDLFVLDFFNSTDDIKAAFDDFYTSTTLSQATDVNILHELKAQLDDVGVYEWEEVETFTQYYFEGKDANTYLSPIIQQAEHRFNHELALSEEEKADYKIKAKQFVKIYGQMASILPYEILKWEQLFWFLKFLIPKMVVKTKEDELIDQILESVDLNTYGLERTKLSHSIELDVAETELDPQNPNPRGAHGSDADKDPLDEIIRTFNERWFQGWDATPDEQRVRILSLSKIIAAHPDYPSKVANNPDVQNRDLAFARILDEVMSRQRKQELELYKLYAKDEAFHQSFIDTMKHLLYTSRT
jgi:type I restriction enzyme, R subunit